VLSLVERLKIVPQIGSVNWIGIRPSRGAAMTVIDEVEAIVDRGLVGDRYTASGSRQVTMIQAEHLPVISALVGRDVTPTLVRRNLVVSGINLISLQKQRFAIGDVILVGTSACAPCDKMDAALGPGGFQAMRGHGGICAKIERGGLIRRGDAVRVID
jgi:MOSC domain-containing protein YiiM